MNMQILQAMEIDYEEDVKHNGYYTEKALETRRKRKHMTRNEIRAPKKCGKNVILIKMCSQLKYGF